MRRLESIRSKLIVWVLVPSLLLWIGSSWWIYRTATHSAAVTYDYILQTFLETVSYRVRMVDGKIQFDFPVKFIPVLREHHVDSRFYQILGPNRELIAGDASLPPPPDFPNEAMLFNGYYRGKPVRIAAQHVIVPETNLKCYIQIVETMTGRQEVGAQALLSLAAGGIILMLLIIIKTLVAMKQILSPLNRIRQQLLEKSIEKIDPLSEDEAPLEIRPLVSAINTLLVRLRFDVDRQKRFVCNAAHQLRTPLSGLKLQTELALRDEHLQNVSPTLLQVKKSIDQTTHLVGKLLSLATSEQPMVDGGQLEKCDMIQILRSVTSQLAPIAIRKDIDIGIEGSNTPKILMAENWALNELTLNIIENALLYTPEGGRVTATVRIEKNQLIFRVVDNGCGIPPEERERAFEPFYRLPNSDVAGSGLGLAIVRELAARYNARVSIDSPYSHPGTMVVVSFPL